MFAKGNKLWKRGLEVRKQKQAEIEKMMITFVNGSFESYVDFMEKLRDDKDLTKSEKEFMDRLERQFEFAFPKRARVDKNGEDVENKIEVVIKNEYAKFEPTVPGDD